MKYTIAIDGPAGAGKSTIAKLLASELNILYLDTGAMYRAVGLKALRENIDIKDTEKIDEMIKNIDIQVRYIDGKQHTYLDGEDVTHKIRTPEVSLAASNVAVIKSVRLKMVELQREIAKDMSVIMDGRDIGTYVLPNAPFKFFITATPEERARRRYLEMKESGEKNVDYDIILKDIKYRDENDSTRAFAPLKKADDAILVDNTFMTVEETLSKILSHIKGDGVNQ
ncbi:MAG: (d)CMP kinase [Clostridia bacterium]|jgi:cytidylate kinase|nr:(d)CMP kinase [Clostridiaceae bacterium]